MCLKAKQTHQGRFITLGWLVGVVECHKTCSLYGLKAAALSREGSTRQMHPRTMYMEALSANRAFPLRPPVSLEGQPG